MPWISQGPTADISRFRQLPAVHRCSKPTRPDKARAASGQGRAKKMGISWGLLRSKWWFHGDFMVISWWFHGDFMVISWWLRSIVVNGDGEFRWTVGIPWYTPLNETPESKFKQCSLGGVHWRKGLMAKICKHHKVDELGQSPVATNANYIGRASKSAHNWLVSPATRSYWGWSSSDRKSEILKNSSKQF